MNRLSVLCSLIVFVLLLGLVSSRSFALQQEEKKQEEQKEPEAVDIEDAAKQATKPGTEVGYTKEEYDEFQKAYNNPDLKLRADGLAQFVKVHANSKLNEHALAAFAPIITKLYEQKDMANLGTVAETFLQMKPDDILALGSATEAFHVDKDYAKAGKYG